MIVSSYGWKWPMPAVRQTMRLSGSGEWCDDDAEAPERRSILIAAIAFLRLVLDSVQIEGRRYSTPPGYGSRTDHLDPRW